MWQKWRLHALSSRKKTDSNWWTQPTRSGIVMQNSYTKSLAKAKRAIKAYKAALTQTRLLPALNKA